MSTDVLVWRLYTARDSFQTLSAEFKHAWLAAPVGTRLKLVVPFWKRLVPRFSRASMEKRPTAEQASAWLERIYVRKPDRWRGEVHTTGGSAHIFVIRGPHRWILTPRGELFTDLIPSGFQGRVRRMEAPLGHPSTVAEALADHPCLDPSFLLGSFVLECLGEERWAGRAAWRVRARAREGKGRTLSLLGSPFGEVDEVELLVDEERGVVLRYELRAQNKVLGTIEVQNIAFEVPVPEELFEFPRDVRGPLFLCPS